MKRTSLHFLWKDRDAPRRYPTAVSLHGHTLHSWENLRFLHSFKLPLPLIPAVLRVAGVSYFDADPTSVAGHDVFRERIQGVLQQSFDQSLQEGDPWGDKGCAVYRKALSRLPADRRR